MKTPDVVAKEIIAKLAFTAPGLSLELGTPERKIVDAVSEAISEAYIDEYLVGSLMDIESKAGLELEQWCGIFGFGRLQGRKAAGDVRVELRNGTSQDIPIPSSTPFYTRQALPSSGNPVFFTSTQAVIIPAGSTEIDVPVECTVVGTAGNLPPDSVVYLGDILGATNVTNLQAFTGGVDIETDDELRQRFKDTFLRNVAGTEDYYLGMCYQNRYVSKAACFGPVRKYATQIEVSDDIDLGVDLDVKYAWPGDSHISVFKDLGQDTETFYRPVQDFDWVAGSSPALSKTAESAMTDGEIVDLEFEYVTRSSRNDPSRGIANKVDLFVNGNYSYQVTERTLIDNSSVITSNPQDQLYKGNFTRVGATYLRSESQLTNATMSEVSVTGDGPYEVSLTNTPTGGTWALSYGGDTTTALAWDAPPVIVQAALAALPSIGSGNATVSQVLDGDGLIVFGKYAVLLGVSSSVLTGSSELTNATASQVEVSGTNVSLTNTPTGGTYTLTYGSQTTTALAYDASVGTIQAALASLTSIGAGNVEVSGSSLSYSITLTPQTKVPLAGNRFMRLGSAPVVSVPSTLTVNGVTYTRGIHYHLLRLAPESQTIPSDATLVAGSVYENVGLEWESTGPSPDSGATVVPVTITYTYNRVPEMIQAMVTAGKQVSTDVLVHQASHAYLQIHLSVEYDRGFVVSQVNNAIQERMREYLAGMPYGAWIEFSDLVLAAHQVLGVDNVNLTTSSESASKHGVMVFASSADSVPIVIHDTDFKLADNQLPVFLDAVIRRKANR